GFSILKVGPWLTFALREALYALDGVADILEGRAPSGSLMATMEAVMQAEPDNWEKYYHGDETELWLQRHFSLSDRIRYYWPDAQAREAVEELYARLDGKELSEPILSQFLPMQAEMKGADCHQLLVGSVKLVLDKYERGVSA
ncbi:MAG: class II D-tagatose-bisphosphate aldolase, non-catalytic subunit, partial [Pseudomonadota bacterium]